MNLKDVTALEAQIGELIAEVRTAVVENVKNSPMDGVRPVSTSPRACVVSLSTVMKNKLILTPEYYIQESQAALIEQKLTGLTTATALTKAVREMLDSKQVKIGTERHPLNPSTLGVLRKFAEE